MLAGFCSPSCTPDDDKRVYVHPQARILRAFQGVQHHIEDVSKLLVLAGKQGVFLKTGATERLFLKTGATTRCASTSSLILYALSTFSTKVV